MMKKFIGGLTLMTALSTPVAMTSCSEDDVNTVLELLDALIGSTDELSNTVWYRETPTFVQFSFGANRQGMYYDDSTGETGIAFTYSLTENTLRLQFSDQTLTFTVTAYTAQSSMTLKGSDGATLTLQYYSGQ